VKVEVMPQSKPVHMVPQGDNWAIKREGNQRATSLHDTQREAEQAGRPTARQDKTEFFLLGRDGKTRQRDSYGNDPSPPRLPTDHLWSDMRDDRYGH
jgi:hypothetical protein